MIYDQGGNPSFLKVSDVPGEERYHDVWDIGIVLVFLVWTTFVFSHLGSVTLLCLAFLWRYIGYSGFLHSALCLSGSYCANNERRESIYDILCPFSSAAFQACG